uniref:ANK_REP_REGION domain-containing protein n=1 Tax=Globodera pallida TaxID=36090 RepID=A0A183BI84_GLOPA
MVQPYSSLVNYFFSLIRAGDAEEVFPLFLAASLGHLEVCKLLVAKGADVNRESEDGGSPWLEACKKGHLDIVEFFVRKCQDIDVTDSVGYTGLTVASREGKANLRFDNVPFPAITVCNLNPFKRELARRVPEISEVMIGGFRYVQYEPVMSDCECLDGYFGDGRTTTDCAQLDTVPKAAHATRWYAKCMWLAISLASVGIFCYNVHGVLQKYWRKDKITTVQLRFDNVPFPAITVCNLNPFKRELARRVPEISETLDAFHQAVTYSKHADQNYDESAASRERRNIHGGFRYVQYEPVMSDCECLGGYFGDGRTTTDCAQLDTVPKDNVSLCICNYDRQDSSVWPCYSKASWIEAMCPDCNDIGYCNLPYTNGTNPLPCLCQKHVNYCLLRPERMKRIWEIRGRVIPDEGSPFRSDYLDQLKELGYENMTDEVAITTKTIEKLVLTMAGLPEERRIALSYGRGEFIRMCSFNGQQCNINNDFKLHVDPAFGNCYTFNANREKPLGSSRAGPSYGLRLLVHINTSDYLATTQSAGVRIAIHSQDEHPFPDAFGYSARKLTRLPIPAGECLMPDLPLPNWYIYKDYKYEPEGCYKSCYQNQIILRCGCADPRYPPPNNYTKVSQNSQIKYI